MASAYTPIPNEGHHLPTAGEALLINHLYEDAIPLLNRDLQRSEGGPNHAQALLNLGVALEYTGKLESAVNVIERSIMLDPNRASAWHNLSVVATDKGEFDAALIAAHNAYRLDPNLKIAGFQYGSALLREGRWTEAWPVWDASRDCPSRAFMRDWELWDQSKPVAGKRFLIFFDGGLGDTFLWAPRYAALWMTAGAEAVDVVCWSGQGEVLRRLGCFRRVIEEGREASISADAYDYWVPTMSLPAAWGTTPRSVPTTPLLSIGDIPADRNAVGVCWQAGEMATTHKFRSWTEDQVDALAQGNDGITFYSLRPGPCPPWMKPLTARNWTETAELIASLGLVISVDTAVAHLAGMMRKPLWIALHAGSDWKWLRDAETTAWWPGARLVRAETPEDFVTMPQRLARELRQWQ